MTTERTRKRTSEDPGERSERSESRRRPDYILVSAYILIYLEFGWLIFMALRLYSRH